MKIKLIIFILILSNFNIYSQNSDILWVHGVLDERNEDWKINLYDLAVKTSIPFYSNNKIEHNYYIYNNINKEHTSNSGIPKYGDQINDFIKSKNINTNNLIYIGYSMGGMAGQYLNVHKNLKFKGIISIGSFFNGAKVANSIKPKLGDFGPSDLSNFGLNAINNSARGIRGLSGPVLALAYDLIFGLGSVVNFAAGGAIFGAIIKLPANGKTINDFALNSTYIKDTRFKSSNTPKLQIYGVAETPPVDMWLKHFKRDKEINDLKAFYKDAIDVLRWIPFSTILIAECDFSLDYLKNGINTDFMNLINDDVKIERKSYEYWKGFKIENCFNEQQRNSVKKCAGWWIFSFICQFFETIINVVRCVVNTVFKVEIGYYYETTYGETDGIITKKSAIGEGTYWNGTPIRLEKYNHLELVDLSKEYDDQFGKKNNLRKIFEKSIFTGVYGISFKP